MQNLPAAKEGALILVGCGPDEGHELAALMFAILLRQEGYFVEYLGPDLPVEDLLDYAAQVRPKLIVLASIKKAQPIRCAVLRKNSLTCAANHA